MNEMDTALAKRWIKSHEEPESTDEASDSTEELKELCEDYPYRAIQTLYFIANNTDSENVLANLGAGPLENFLNTDSGAGYIDDIIAHAKKSINWRLAFGCVWTVSFKDRQLAEKIELNINLLFPASRP